MKNLKKIKDEIKYKFLFQKYPVKPCWKCKYYKLNRVISWIRRAFVCSLGKATYKRWGGYSEYLRTAYSRSTRYNDIIEEVLIKYNVINKR